MQHGLSMLFVVLLVGSLAIPFPTNILVVAAGSLVQQGEMDLFSLLAVLMIGSLIGNNIGFALGRWGGRSLVRRFTKRFGGESKFAAADDLTRRWGSAGIFFTRWLVSSLGPFVNVTCGLTDYSWGRFLCWGVLGQSIWVSIYVSLGYFFSDRVQQVGELLVDVSAAILGLILALVLGWQLLRYFFSGPDDSQPFVQPKPIKATGG